jgi:pimeloyl-ACP methyl ester carboxylesterase
MRNFKFKRSLTLVAVTSLLSITVVSIPTAAQAAPACTTANYVTTCLGATTDTAPYMLITPANFNGTVYLWSHGYRPNVDVPAGIPGYGGYKVTNTPEPAPGGNPQVIGALLAKGYAVMGSGFARQGWNANSAVKTNVELIGIYKKQYPKTTKVISWGNSLGGFQSQYLAEKHPELINSAGALCLSSDVMAISDTAADALWLIKTFFDPTIKAGNYSAGAAGYAEAMGDLVKVFTVIGAMQAGIAANPTAPAWPATSKVPDALKAVPSRSALVLIALLTGLPMQSAHFDGTSAPAGIPASSALSFQLAINPSLAALENIANAAALAAFQIYDLELQTGGVWYDNTATDWAARVADERFIWASALSGESATNALLGYLAAVPKAQGNPVARAKVAALGTHTGISKIPTILYTGVADPILGASQQQSIIDKNDAYRAQLWPANKDAAVRKRTANNQLALWGIPAAKYTKFTAAGSPDTTGAATPGTNHCNFTVAQYLAIADLLAYAADNGKHLSGGPLLTKIRKAGNMTYDRNYVAPKLKH